MSKGLYIRIDEALLQRLDRACRSMGHTRSEAVREAIRRFALTEQSATRTHQIRGLVKSKLSAEDLEAIYEALR